MQMIHGRRLARYLKHGDKRGEEVIKVFASTNALDRMSMRVAQLLRAEQRLAEQQALFATTQHLLTGARSTAIGSPAELAAENQHTQAAGAPNGFGQRFSVC